MSRQSHLVVFAAVPVAQDAEGGMPADSQSACPPYHVSFHHWSCLLSRRARQAGYPTTKPKDVEPIVDEDGFTAVVKGRRRPR